VHSVRLNRNLAWPDALVMLLPMILCPPEYPGCISLKLTSAGGLILLVFLSLSKALTVSIVDCAVMITVVSFPVPSLLWLYVMLVASFLSVIEKSVPDVAVTGESFILNWKNHCPMRSVAGSLLVKFRSQYLVSSVKVVCGWFD